MHVISSSKFYLYCYKCKSCKKAEPRIILHLHCGLVLIYEFSSQYGLTNVGPIIVFRNVASTNRFHKFCSVALRRPTISRLLWFE